MSLPKPTMTVTIGGVITNRVEIKKVRRERKQSAPATYHADPTVADVTVRCFSAPEELWQAIDDGARQLKISRSEFLRRGAFLMLDHLAERADRSARGCGAGTASCTSRSVPGTTAPRSKR